MPHRTHDPVRRLIRKKFEPAHPRQPPPYSTVKNGTQQRRTVRYSGRVQGVGFRYSARSIARQYRVSGYVRNLPDGSVELVAEGEPREVDDFLREVRERFASNIRGEQSDVQPATGEFIGFDIRH